MSFESKCLEINPRLMSIHWTEGNGEKRYFVYSPLGEVVGSGKSAATAWKAAWERLKKED